MLLDWLPAWLLWLLPVPLATTAAIAWASWSSRARGPVEAAESVRQHERFRAALAGTQAPPHTSTPRVTPSTEA